MAKNRKDPSGNPLPPRCYWKHGAWWYVYRNKWVKLSSTSYSAAMAAYGRQVSPSQGGFGALVDRALEAHFKQPVAKTGKPPKPNTVKSYLVTAQKIKSVFAEFDADQITRLDIQQAHEYFAALGPGTANHFLSVTRIVLSYAVRWGLVRDNVALGVKACKEPERKRYLEDWEFKAIQSNALPWLAILMDIGYLTGQRIGDLLQIRTTDCVEDGLRFNQQKGDTKLIVEWTPELRDAVERARRLHGNVLPDF